MFSLQAGKVHGVAHALNARGGTGRSDFESETFVAHPLRAEGADASEDGTGRGTPLVVSRLLKAGGNLRHDESHDTLIASPITSSYAKTASDDNDGLNGHLVVNAFNGYTGGHDDNDAQGNHLVVSLAENQRGELRTGDISPQLSCSGGKPGSGYPAIAFMAGQGSKAGSVAASEHISPTLRGAQSGSNRCPSVAHNCGVRRLTPTECERLMGLPDGFTAGESDSARYRMLGNSIVVPTALWIAKRIVARAGRGDNDVTIESSFPASPKS